MLTNGVLDRSIAGCRDRIGYMKDLCIILSCETVLRPFDLISYRRARQRELERLQGFVQCCISCRQRMLSMPIELRFTSLHSYLYDVVSSICTSMNALLQRAYYCVFETVRRLEEPRHAKNQRFRHLAVVFKGSNPSYIACARL